jgi:prolyl 4-hydroxylase
MSALLSEALAMIGRGEADAARMRVDAGCAGGDGDALALRALWRVEGKLLPRDLTEARADLTAAARRGNAGAARMLGGLLASGVGGSRDWQGALALLAEWREHDPLAARQASLIAKMAIDAEGDPTQLPRPRALSEAPLIRIFPGLFTADECDFLVELAERRLRPAVIFHEGQGRFVADPIRDSDAAGFPILSEWSFVHALNRRLARASDTTIEQGEPLQLLRYKPGQQYRPHLDALPGLANQRILTFLVYLSDDHAGGETRFTRIGIDVVARKGDGLLFSNSMGDGRPDPMSEHAGLPVRSGVKRIASRWIRQRAPDGPDGFGQHEMMR